MNAKSSKAPQRNAFLCLLNSPETNDLFIIFIRPILVIQILYMIIFISTEIFGSWIIFVIIIFLLQWSARDFLMLNTTIISMCIFQYVGIHNKNRKPSEFYSLNTWMYRWKFVCFSREIPFLELLMSTILPLELWFFAELITEKYLFLALYTFAGAIFEHYLVLALCLFAQNYWWALFCIRISLFFWGVLLSNMLLSGLSFLM